MCTLSWIRGVAGYSVFMNRDERPTRAAGLPPSIQDGPVPWIAPIDGQSHGTWIGANGHGVTLAILNRWHESPMSAEGEWISRGLLVTSLIGEKTKDDVERRLREEPLKLYQPFTLAAFEVGRGARLLAWNGEELSLSQVVDTGLVLTSSGFDQEMATRDRGALFKRWKDFDPTRPTHPTYPTPESFEAIHASHIPDKGPLSICMHRPEAGTVSFTRIDVRPDSIDVHYIPGPPGETTERIARSLPRTSVV
ncbi:MAG TPA: NRDE family protein [Gemmatimonadales bacterium]|nr:NRDE family protein [Gemmatimonadales bacterium]